ncbi:MAG: glycosyl transferase [Candidatus Riflebacteria bacterium HGW-Riflebacteria-1]|nr:MAG: glycosyl transferase [Candidatus Riflebacteria bacterium HGW-Riflebacteria-1]
MIEASQQVTNKPAENITATPKGLYAAFDTFPAPKGAAVHIREFAQTLFTYTGSGLLLVLGDEELPSWQIEGSMQIRRLASGEPNYLKRAMQFGEFVYAHAEMLRNDLQIAHFRDPWGGIPMLDVKNRSYKTVYEVNSLPSIELPARYGNISSRTCAKIRRLEQRCWEEADRIICPSQVIRNCLISLGASADKITVIPNGAHIIDAAQIDIPADAPGQYLIYFGAVQSWQGLEVLFKAMTFLRDLSELKLVLCVSGSKPRLKYLQKLAARMSIEHQLIWQMKVPQIVVSNWLAGAAISVAPLVECARNLTQGCCPIKIVESMAMAKPVIASDLPVVRELIDHNDTGWLIRPDRPSELARAIRILLAHPDECRRIGENAQKKAAASLTWATVTATLAGIYRQLTAENLADPFQP